MTDQAILRQLRTLVTYPDLQLGPNHLEFIKTRGQAVAASRCTSVIHPGMSCKFYFVWTQLQYLRHFLKYCVMFALLPGFYTYRKSLNSLQSWKLIMKKYIRTVLLYTVMAATPSAIGCLIMPLFKRPNQLFTIIRYIVGNSIGFSLVGAKHHLSLTTYLVQKSIELFLGVQHVRFGGPKFTAASLKYFVIFAMALIGYFEYVSLREKFAMSKK